jgi:hypothetical protein
MSFFGGRVHNQSSFAFLFVYPEYGVVGIAVDGFVFTALFEKSQGVDDSKKFANIVGAFQWAEVEYFGTGAQVDAAIFHWARITRTGSIHGPGLRLDFGM